MMNYNEFKVAVEENFMGYLPKEYQAGAKLCIRSVNKINVVLDGMSLAPISADSTQMGGCTLDAAPIIYINDMYEAYCASGDFENVLMSYALDWVRTMREKPDVHNVLDFSKAKDNIVFQLISTEENVKLLADIPHRPFLDLSVIYRWELGAHEESEQYMSCVINNNIMEKLGLNEEQLFQLAFENTRRIMPPTVINLQELLKRMGAFDDCEELEDSFQMPSIVPLWVVSNSRSMRGASSILYDDILLEIADKIGGSYYVLPSSIHECLAVSADSAMSFGGPEMLAEMVCDVNNGQVAEQERLSYEVYFYDSCSGKLSIATAERED